MEAGTQVKIWRHNANGRKIWENAVVLEWRGRSKEELNLSDYVEVEDQYGERVACHKKYIWAAR